MIRTKKARKMRRRICFLLSLVFLISSVSGCGLDGTQMEDLNYAISTTAVTIDPQLSTDIASAEVVNLYSCTLYTYDENRKLVPGLAESSETSPDGMTVTYHLRHGLKWSDGRDLTAEDFVFAMQRLANPDTKSGAVYIITGCCYIKNASKISMGKMPVSELGVSAPDPYTFVIELEMPCPYLNALVTHTAFIPCNREFFQSCGDNYATSPETLICCGPFEVDRYEPLGTQIHYTKNEYFYAADQINLKGVNVQVITDTQQAMMCYQSGEMDVIGLNGTVLELAEGDPSVKKFTKPSARYIDMNITEGSIFMNKSVRMAFAKSIDRESIVDNVLLSNSTALYRINPSGYYYETDGTDIASDPLKYKEEVGYDPAKAKELWEQGMKELGKKEASVSLGCIAGTQNLAEIIKDQLERNLPGLSVKLQVWSPKEWLQRMETADGYDMIICGWVADYADPTSFYSRYLTDNTATTYSNSTFDAIYNKTQYAEGEERDRLLEEAEDILMKDVAQLPISGDNANFLVASGVTGFKYNPTASGMIVFGIRKEVK